MNENISQNISHTGVWVWGLAIIMIVLVSWLLYKYLAPKSWHEWAGVGVVQALSKGYVYWAEF
ncbi:hypothetical protein MNBD_GAMMA01-518 [hydrothermal vent metagenome]|uniref:Uncharacterized protein n=1 Tax=hydrothermal vent metagenome TaxID=652676 RepID=A0A3B0UWC3_9ZZZZ